MITCRKLKAMKVRQTKELLSRRVSDWPNLLLARLVLTNKKQMVWLVKFKAFSTMP